MQSGQTRCAQPTFARGAWPPPLLLRYKLVTASTIWSGGNQGASGSGAPSPPPRAMSSSCPTHSTKRELIRLDTSSAAGRGAAGGRPEGAAAYGAGIDLANQHAHHRADRAEQHYGGVCACEG